MPEPHELAQASLPCLIAMWQSVAAEHANLADTLPCVEPEDARDDLRQTIQRDYATIQTELARRRALTRHLAQHAGDDGLRLLLYPDPPAA
jgi:hypothetical protein